MAIRLSLLIRIHPPVLPMSGPDSVETTRDNPDRSDDAVSMVASSTVRIGILLLGVILLLYASGQAMGIDVLAMISEQLNTQEIRWLIVAFFALVMISIALRGFR